MISRSHQSPNDLATSQSLRVCFRTLPIPLARDGVAIGRQANVAPETILETLRVSSKETFVEVPLTDDVLGHLFVREAILRRIEPARVAEFVLRKVKPFMSAGEVLQLDLDVELVFDERL